jgi:hypothetical protein
MQPEPGATGDLYGPQILQRVQVSQQRVQARLDLGAHVARRH